MCKLNNPELFIAGLKAMVNILASIASEEVEDYFLDIYSSSKKYK